MNMFNLCQFYIKKGYHQIITKEVGTNNTMEGDIVEDIDDALIDDKVEGTAGNAKPTNEKIIKYVSRNKKNQ